MSDTTGPENQPSDPQPSETPEARLRAAMPDLTRAERQLATHMLGNYPVAVLGSVASVARGAGVSGPTVVRLVQKLGYSGYPEFQAQLREEVGEKLASPIAKREKWAGDGARDHVLDSFATKVIENVSATLGQIDHASFDAVADLLADRDRRIAMLGGRLTHPVAEYLATTLRVTRGEVSLWSNLPNSWPPALLDMREGDVLVAFDIRRYEASVTHIVELARAQGAEVVLITDRWVSPAAAHAQHILPCHIEAPSAWDSIAALVMLSEALLAGVQNRSWDQTSDRLQRMESLYARAQLFRRAR
ncbi:MurR/RpiR family transcriptional regulator [Pararhodobacter sp. CCB-MM2]|uniref:MurR/RpiR family transcriptional regulator n=1 Tax=Pararhodobacter sp. CCB-MM2 TaxID=1786003 RepID=UPI0008369B0F|nr:MurR/RpiR family transcriptional regulator [Pararhodobacter sp. CCB-MM2]MCA2012773.1 MurR/RpiR family transcriptional regulator [Cereibacter sphaeroides]